jgi:hypothetical protein
MYATLCSKCYTLKIRQVIINVIFRSTTAIFGTFERFNRHKFVEDTKTVVNSYVNSHVMCVISSSATKSGCGFNGWWNMTSSWPSPEDGGKKSHVPTFLCGSGEHGEHLAFAFGEDRFTVSKVSHEELDGGAVKTHICCTRWGPLPLQCEK